MSGVGKSRVGPGNLRVEWRFPVVSRTGNCIDLQSLSIGIRFPGCDGGNALEGGIPDPDVFTHVRVIIGIILGLSVSRLLTGVARIELSSIHSARTSSPFISLGFCSPFLPWCISGGSNSTSTNSYNGRSRPISLSSSLRAFTSLPASSCFQTAWTLFRL
jgi:hypothetical protein